MATNSSSADNMIPAAVTLHNIRKHYREGSSERVVLDSLNATFYQGEIIALLGRSGSGKSTVLNLVSGIDAPSSGDVIINATTLNHLSEQQRTLFRRRHIGFVFQFFNLIPTLTVEENLLLPLELNGDVTDEHRHELSELLERIGLAGRRSSYPENLSGGEQQRVAIARAVIHHPRLLLADEPTGNLDEETGRQVLSLLKDLALRYAMTVILVTHSRDIAATAQRVFTLTEGRLQEGTGTELP